MKDELSHKRICFTSDAERRRAFVEVVSGKNPQMLVNLSQTYTLFDGRKRRVALCLHDKPHRYVCIFCLKKTYQTIEYEGIVAYGQCVTCIEKGRYLCRDTLINDDDCAHTQQEKCCLLFQFGFPVNDIIFHIIRIYQQLPCPGCTYAQKKVKKLQKKWNTRRT